MANPTPYQAPATFVADEAPPRALFPLGRIAIGTLVLSMVVFGAGLAFDGDARQIGQLFFLASALLGVVAGSCACIAIVKRQRGAPTVTPASAILLALTSLGGGFMALVGAVAALMAVADFTRGRQLRRFGRVLLPRLAARGAWTLVPLEPRIVPDAIDERRALATRWRENGRTEHASVAAFARLTLDLMSLGAPPEMLRAAQRDADDEIAHAEMCFSLARALDGEETSPAPFPEARRAGSLSSVRSVALAELAVDSLIDGALHEGVSARIVARLAKRCEDPAIRNVLKTIAADEGRHAAHGWDVVRYCLDEGGEGVARALRASLSALPREMKTPLPDEAAKGRWERYGIHGHALEHEEYAAARADLIRRVTALCDTRASARAPRTRRAA